MNTLKTCLTAFTFALAGVAVHASAATEKPCADTQICFQLAPVHQRAIAENGSEKTPLGMLLEERSRQVAESGSDRTPLGMKLEERSRWVAEGGSEHTGVGKWIASQNRV